MNVDIQFVTQLTGQDSYKMEDIQCSMVWNCYLGLGLGFIIAFLSLIVIIYNLFFLQ